MVLEHNYYVNKANGFFRLAQKYYKKANTTSMIHILRYGKTYKKNLLDAAREHSNIAIISYDLINQNNKTIEILIFKSIVEKKLKHPDYFDTMISIGNYYANKDTVNYMQASTYYVTALFYAINLSKVDDKIINLCLMILKKYKNILTFSECRKIYKIVIEYYFNKEEYHNAYIISNQFADHIISKKIKQPVINIIFYWVILSLLANKDLITSKIKFDSYQNYSNSFQNSAIAKFINDILTFADKNNIDAFTKSIIHYDSVNHMNYYEIAILMNLFI